MPIEKYKECLKNKNKANETSDRYNKCDDCFIQ
jgi:hypothetical protein